MKSALMGVEHPNRCLFSHCSSHCFVDASGGYIFGDIWRCGVSYGELRGVLADLKRSLFGTDGAEK